MTTHQRLLATTVLTGLTLLAPATAAFAADLVIDDGDPVLITTPGNYGVVKVGVDNPGQSLTISGDGQVTSGSGEIGLNAGSDDNSVTVTGANAAWSVDDEGIYVGWTGSGNRLDILDGANVQAGIVTLGYDGTSAGNILRVAGNGSRLSVGDGLVVGQINDGNKLLIEGGGSVVSGWAAIGLGYESAENNHVTVTGVGSAWEIGENPAVDYQTLFVGGNGGLNTLTVSDGGRVEAFEDFIAGGVTGADNNAITVSGAGSLLRVHENFVLGDGSDGNSVSVLDGGSLVTGFAASGDNIPQTDRPRVQMETGLAAYIGGTQTSKTGSNGNYVDVSGQGASWSIYGDLYIGAIAQMPDQSNDAKTANGGPVVPVGNYLRVADGGAVTQTKGDTVIGTPVPEVSVTADRPEVTSYYNGLSVQDAGSSFSTGGNITVRGNGVLKTGEAGLIEAGSLTLTDGSRLEVHVSDDAASRIEIAGVAELKGTLHATIGGDLARDRYTVLDAAETSGDFTDFTYDGYTDFLSIGYEITGTSVDLLFASRLNGLDGLNENQRNTAGAIDGFFNGGGELGGAFSALFGLSEQELPRALSEMSGEVGATGGAQAAEQANTSFLTLMTRPRVNAPAGSEMAARMGDVTVLPTADAAAEGGGWSMWGAVFGGAADLPGDSNKGSHDTDTTAIGIATGWDHALSADTTLGLALAGGGTSWDLGGAMGSGDSTFLQLGANASHRMGASYLSLAGAYAWHAMSTERRVTVPASEKLEADFNTNALAGRIEGGHRFGAGHAAGLTPYAALQAQAIYLPDYDEDSTLGRGSFALSYDSNTATAVRGELGLGLDATLGGGRLWGRAAWAHDWNSDGNVSAAFQSLPGAGFTVNGAESPEDIALLSLGAEIGVTEAGVLAASFDGEFGEEYESYAGSLKLGFNW